MKLSVALLFASTMAAAAAVTTSPEAAKLRGSVPAQAVADAAAVASSILDADESSKKPSFDQLPALSGTVEAQVAMMGDELDHDLTAMETVLADTCFAQAYNEAYESTGYTITQFDANKTMFHDPTPTMTNNNMGAAASVGVTTVKRIVYVYGYGNYQCARCWRRSVVPLVEEATSAAEQQRLASLHRDFVDLFQSCMALGGYQGLETAQIGFLVPRPVSVVVAAAAASAQADDKKKKSVNTVAALPESDIYLYGLESELSAADQAVVTGCLLSSYNTVYTEASGWSVSAAAMQWQLPMIGDGFLLMDVAITYSCTGCSQGRPDEDVTTHSSFEYGIASCIQSSSSNGFAGLQSVEVRSMDVLTTTVDKALTMLTASAADSRTAK